MKRYNHVSQKIKSFMQKADAAMKKHPIRFYFLYSLCLCFVVEILCRRSLFGAFSYLFESPVLFLYNTLIVLFTLSFSLFIPNKFFFLGLMSAGWLALGITNFVVLGYRITPIGFIDIALLDSFWGIMGIYLNVWQIILICIGIIFVLAGSFWVWKNLPKWHIGLAKSITSVSALALALFLMTSLASAKRLLPEDFGNLADDYENYGFAYCFSRSVIDRGVEKPEKYSEEEVQRLLAELGEDYCEGEQRPNVIFLQLEAFFDPKYLKGISFSADPTPVFTELKRTSAHGFLTVPSLGAGTANTEFEIITAMNISHFGAGEYPYKTILADSTCETVAYNFTELGYSCHAIHNHSGSFYDRHEVYARLGFDTYTSLEYMQNVEENPLGWAKDKVLTKEIFNSLSSTETKDLLYVVSVQGHGKYPREVIDETQKIKAEGFSDEKEKNAFEYFVNQIHETDAFLGELILALSEYQESTMVVLFGDHLPGLEIDNGGLSGGSIFTTEYVIWRNYESDIENKSVRDVEAYQLSSLVYEQLGYNIGTINKLHSRYAGEDTDYQEELKLLEYDMLYGEGYLYKDGTPYEKKNMKMGSREIKISSTYEIGERLYVKGEGFTEYSRVYVDGKRAQTDFVNNETLVIDKPKEMTELCIGQVGSDGIVLSFSQIWTQGE